MPTLLIGFASVKFCFYSDLVNFHLNAVLNILERPYVDMIEIVNILDNFNINKKFNQIKNKNDKLVEKISVAKQIYGLVWESTELVNDCFGWTLLMIFILMSSGLTVSGYLIFVLLQKDAPLFMFTS